MAVSISGDGAVTGVASVDTPTTLSGLTIPTLGFGKVLQVVEGFTTTTAINNTSTLADTNLTATITPSSASSKILVLVSQNGVLKTANSGSGVVVVILRGATQIAQIASTAGYNGTTTRQDIAPISGFVLDSPATTSATTYKTQFANQINSPGVYCQNGGDRSSIILVEVGP